MDTVGIVNALFTFLWLAILARVILSYFPGGGNNPIGALVFQITEPLLAPLRRILPTFGILDITPMVAIIILFGVQSVVIALISS